ncbi:MAG: alpha/beta fold hydrolase [Asticcacaulis sp.]
MSRIAALSTQAPLMSVPGAECPPGGQGEWFRGAGGLRLRVGFWAPDGPARGTVFVSPGRAEPIEKYYETVRDLLARDFAVVAHDWRGQGLSARLLSERLKGHARTTDEFMDDFGRLLDAFEDRAPKPWLMLGHSMGAAINLLSLIEGETRIAAAIFSGPMLRIRTGRHSMWAVAFNTRWKVRQGEAPNYVPELFDDPFEHTFENNALTSDRVRYERWREQLFACPHLALGSPTWGWLAFALDVGDRVMKSKVLKRLKVPITLVQAGEDSIVNKAAAKLLAKRLGEARYVEVNASEHEVLMETDDKRALFFAEFEALADGVAPRPESWGVAEADVEPTLHSFTLNEAPDGGLEAVPEASVDLTDQDAPSAVTITGLGTGVVSTAFTTPGFDDPSQDNVSGRRI